MKAFHPRSSPRGTAISLLVAVLSILLSPSFQATANQTDASRNGSAQSPPAAPPVASTPTDRDSNSYTEAERITRLQQLVKQDQQRLQQLRAELTELEFEFERASKEFSQLEAAVTEKTKQVDKPDENLPPEAVAAMRLELADLVDQRKLAQEAFDLIIKRRKTTQSQITTLEEKILLAQTALDRLMGVEPSPANGAVASPTAPDRRRASSEPANQLRETVPATPPAPASSAAGAQELAVEAASSLPTEAAEEPRTADIRVATARKEFEAKDAAVQEAEQTIERLDHALEVFEQDLANEQQSLENAKEQAPMIEDALRRLQTELEQQAGTGADDAALNSTRTKIDQKNRELKKVADSQEASVERIKVLTQQIEAIRASREEAITQLDAAQAEADTARRWLRLLESPLAPHKVLIWLRDRVPKILLVVLLLFGFWWVLRLLVRRTIRGLAHRSSTGSPEEREERALTLIGVLHSVVTITVAGIGMLAVLDQAGVDITVLVGGAAALGVAIGFGAQNLMRDYFYGSMILAENQYRVGNIVKIAGIAGMVEHITLRITVLRDLEGVVHFIPHSQITTVSNLTQGWSQAMFEIGVAYKEDVDQVMHVLMELGRELRQDPDFRGLILDDLEMLGVDAFGNSAVVIKFLIKTRPLKQWLVKRELLRRIKNRFDELGIEIPFPHRTIYHHGLMEASNLEYRSPGELT
ncbi:MAG: mechanosensitive ion channel domain-containing protein [Pirellulaceae bacterium]